MARYRLGIAGGEAATIKLRLTAGAGDNSSWGDWFDEVFAARMREADEFYDRVAAPGIGDDARNIQRQAFAGLLWNKQFYNYDVRRWLRGDPAGPEPPRERLRGPNRDWTHLRNSDVISMPDKWEYPWYASWDLAFHTTPFTLIDPDFAKEQLLLQLREWYMHPNGQLPAAPQLT